MKRWKLPFHRGLLEGVAVLMLGGHMALEGLTLMCVSGSCGLSATSRLDCPDDIDRASVCRARPGAGRRRRDVEKRLLPCEPLPYHFDWTQGNGAVARAAALAQTWRESDCVIPAEARAAQHARPPGAPRYRARALRLARSPR